MKKLDQSKVEYIVAEKRKGTKNATIAESMGISIRYVQKLWARFKNAPNITFPAQMGRPPNGMPGRRVHSIILSTYTNAVSGAKRLGEDIRGKFELHIPHRTIHHILLNAGEAVQTKNKQKQRSWVRYERKHSNSMWHTDFKQLDDGKWFVSYEDDASRFVTGWGVFENATTENAIKVLDRAIAEYGKPRSILTDRGSQFYATESEKKDKGESAFEKHLAELNIKHIKARVNHPQTNGKLERLHGEIQRKLPKFMDVAGPPGTGCPINCPPMETDPMARFMKWYNYERPHMSLYLKTPAESFAEKMPKEGETIQDDD